MSMLKKSRSTRFGRVIGVILLVSGIGLSTLGTSATAASSPTLLASTNPVLSGFPPGTKDEDLPIAVGWGKNSDGELGAGNYAKSTVPVIAGGNDVLTGKVVTAIDAGPMNTCAIADGSVYCWGSNLYGQLGNGLNVGSPVPVKVNGLLLGKQATAVTVGRYHVCAIASDRPYCWGYNQHGELGNASDLISKVPVPVFMGGELAGLTVTAISAGGAHTCAIADARAFCWGSAEVGQLGNDATGGWFTVPVAVDTTEGLKGRPVASIAAGSQHTCALALGKAYCWGRGDVGQLGNSNLANHSRPVAVTSSGALKDLTVVALSAGGNDTCVVGATKTTRRGFCWGAGVQGQLGNGGNTNKSAPTAISGNDEVTAISIGSNGGCTIVAGRGRCWGDTLLAGRLGTNNNPASSLVPIGINADLVLKKRGLLAISTEQYDTMAIAGRVPTIPDVTPANPFYQDIIWFAGFGITTGYDDHTFKPSGMMSRQAMASFMYRLSSISSDLDPECPDGNRIFDDVPQDSPFCGVIEWMANAGITNKSVALFNPTNTVDRSTMAAWLFKFHHRDTAKPECTGNTRLFPADVPKSHPQCGSIEWLAKTGITTGYADGKYHPQDGVSRAAMAAFYHRLIGLTSH